jgi:hypothetical protein
MKLSACSVTWWRWPAEPLVDPPHKAGFARSRAQPEPARAFGKVLYIGWAVL